MKTILKAAIFAFFALGSALSSAADRATPEEAKALLSKAVAYVKANGLDKSIVTFMDKQGGFVDRDLYVAITDVSGKTLSHINPRMIGKDNTNLQDADGKLPIKEGLAVAKSKGQGVIGSLDIRYLNPVTKTIEPKILFVVLVGDVALSSGAYIP